MIPCKQIIREGNICRYTATANGEGKKLASLGRIPADSDSISGVLKVAGPFVALSLLHSMT